MTKNYQITHKTTFFKNLITRFQVLRFLFLIVKLLVEFLIFEMLEPPTVILEYLSRHKLHLSLMNLFKAFIVILFDHTMGKFINLVR